MVTLPPVEGLEFFDDLHRYRFKGNWLATSVTSVCSDLTPFAKAKIEATKDQWLPRGNACHQALEQFLLGDTVHVPDEYASIIEPLLAYPLWDGAEVIACEYRLCDERKSLGGSFDFLLKSRAGKVVLGDLKTVGTTPAVTSRKPATAQLGAYASMLASLHPTLCIDRCVTVVAGPARTHAIAEEPDDCIAVWLDRWDAFQLLQPDF